MPKYRIVRILRYKKATHYQIERFWGFWKIGIWLAVGDGYGSGWWSYDLDEARFAIERLRNPPVKIKPPKPIKEIVE
jgi:hypothetical protein